MKRYTLFIGLWLLPFLGNTQALYIESGATVSVNRGGSASTTPLLYASGAINNLGTLTDAGAIQSTSSFTNVGTYKVHLGGTTLGTDFDQVSNNGAVTLTGSALEVVLVNSYTPVNGASFTIIDGTSLIDTFASSTLPTLSMGLVWQTTYDEIQGTVTLTVSNAALPVELLDFTVTLVPQPPTGVFAVQLDWATTFERNTQDFTLERSEHPLTGKTFTPLSITDAKGSNSVYQYTDDKPYNGINYYRLRITDLDGTISYSKIVSVRLDEAKTFKVYPNPVSDFLMVETITTNDYQIINLLGQHIMGGSLIPQIDVSAFPVGTYIIKIGTEKVQFVKQ